jgi:hypothetical protein
MDRRRFYLIHAWQEIRMITLYKPEDETEAIAITALLEENSIHSSMQSFHDTAYDGLFQGQHGWGIIKVNEADYETAGTLLTNWQTGIPDAMEMLSDLKQKSVESNTSQQHMGLSDYKHLLVPAFLSLSVLLNILFCVMYFSSIRENRTNYDQYDKSNFLMGRIEWGANKYSPYKYISYQRNGEATSVWIDTDDDGRVDRFITHWPNAKGTSIDKDNNGIFEVETIVFDSGSSIENRDHDQNGVCESSTISMANGKAYNLTYSNQNGLMVMIKTPEGDPVSFDVLKQIALEL